MMVFVLVLSSVGAYFGGRQLALTQLAADQEARVAKIKQLSSSAGTALARLMSRNNHAETQLGQDTLCDEQQALAQAKKCTYLVQTDLGHGSGFAITSHHLVTNKHVIEEAQEIFTILEEEKLSLALWNFSRQSDLALLYSEQQLDACNWIDSASIPLAATLFTVGWPNSPEGESSITKGIYSRLVATKEGPTFIQTDAAINPGNSGGPLLSSCGVVGINTAKIAWSQGDVPAEGFSFAISSNYAQPVVEELIENGQPHTLPVKDLGEVEYSFAKQQPPSSAPKTQYTYTLESKQSWWRAKDVTQELKNYWFAADQVDRSRLEQLKDIINRMEAVINTILPKIEQDQSLSTEEQQLLERWNEMYRQAIVLEGQLHNQDYSQGYAYRRCVNYACQLTSGRGVNQCQSSQECAPRYHYQCQDLSCVLAEGEGESECTSHDDCYHYICQGQQCKKIAGDGRDECYFDWQCQ